MIPLVEKLDIPAACYVDKPVYKTQFFKFGHMTAAEQRAFDRAVESVRLLCAFTPDTANIPAFADGRRSYASVVLLQVNLREEGQPEQLAGLIMRTIPYPMLLLFHRGEELQLWMAQEHGNPNHPGQQVPEEMVHSGWLSTDTQLPFTIRTLRFTNLYDFYTDLMDGVSKYIATRKGIGETNTGEAARAQLARLEELEKDLTAKRRQLKKETRFAKKVALNLDIQKLKQQIADSKQGRNNHD